MLALATVVSRMKSRGAFPGRSGSSAMDLAVRNGIFPGTQRNLARPFDP
jgi:hypothetical protein